MQHRLSLCFTCIHTLLGTHSHQYLRSGRLKLKLRLRRNIIKATNDMVNCLQTQEEFSQLCWMAWVFLCGFSVCHVSAFISFCLDFMLLQWPDVPNLLWISVPPLFLYENSWLTFLRPNRRQTHHILSKWKESASLLDWILYPASTSSTCISTLIPVWQLKLLFLQLCLSIRSIWKNF